MLVVNPRFRKGIRSDDYARNRETHWPDFVENYYLEVPCGKCYLCRKKTANGWRVRLLEELKSVPRFRHAGLLKYRCVFVLFTFDNQHLPKVIRRDIIAESIRKWRDLWRKKFGKSPRYFAVTDCGTQNGRLHLHLLIFNPVTKDGSPISINTLEKYNFFWRNGFVREPTWLRGPQGVTYVTGYITGSNLEKEAKKHGHTMCKEAMEFKPFVFVSNGIGANYIKDTPKFYDIERNVIVYPFNGFNYSLPSYYRYKLYDEETRWHSNLIYKKEKEEYLLNHSEYTFRFNGNFMSYSTLESIYNSTYKKFDTDSNKQLKLYYYAKQQPLQTCEFENSRLQRFLVEGVLQDKDYDEFWKLYSSSSAGDTCQYFIQSETRDSL